MAKEACRQAFARLPDAEARIFVRLLRDDLANVIPPKNTGEQTEEQSQVPPDPDAKELEAAVGYLAVCMNQDFARMVLGLHENKGALECGDDTFALERFKVMLRSVGFRWTDDYFEKHWTGLIEQARKQQQDLDEAQTGTKPTMSAGG